MKAILNENPEYIIVGDRLRTVDQAKVDELASSMDELGLQTPIHVRFGPDPEDEDAECFHLVAGAHRLAAAKKLGWQSIDIIQLDIDERAAALWEIDENLIRAELTPTERANCINRRKQIYEHVHPETAHGAVGRAGRGKDANLATLSFVDDTALKTGQSTRKVARDAERGEKVCDEAKAIIKGTKADTGKFLDELKGLPPDEQVRLAKEKVAPTRSKVGPVKDTLSDFEIYRKQLNDIINAWNKAGTEARREFREIIDTPVFDGPTSKLQVVR